MKKKGFFSNKLNIALVSLLVVLIAGIGVVTYSIIKEDIGVKAIDFSTSSPSDVETWATSNGLKDQLTINYEYNETIAENGFLNQEPKAGELITDKLVVTYSKGKDPNFEIEVPTITDTTKLEDIEKWCVTNGFKDVTVEYVNNEEVEKDIVLKLNVTGKVKRSQPIVIYVSSGGDLDAIEIEVADLRGMTKEEVATWAKAHTATIEYTTDFSNTVEEGKVISQSIDPGTTITASTSIKVIISRGKGIEILDFPGDKKSTIQTWATKNNVKLEFVEEYSDTVTKDLCIKTDPGIGSYIAEGDTLTVYMSKGPKATITVPSDLLGISESDFVSKIKALKLNPVKSSTTYYSTKISAGNIYSYDDGKFSEGDTINYSLSAGAFSFNVSEFEGKSRANAINIINNYNNRNANISYNFDTEIQTSEYTAGTLYGCSVSGSRITCNVAKEETYEITNYTGQYDPCNGESQCTINQIVYKRSETKYSDTVDKDNVISQSKTGSASRGTVVNYVLSDGPKPIETKYINSFNAYHQGSANKCNTVDEAKAYMNGQLSGFTNISYEVQDSQFSTGTVLEIKVNGNSQYSPGNYPINTPIVITIAKQYS